MSSEFAGKNILVTGGGGFIGANIIGALEARGAKVFCLVRRQTDLYRLALIQSNCEMVFADLLDFAAIRKLIAPIKPEYVFHTATARNPDDWQTTLSTNGAAVINLAMAASSPKLKKFVHCGSSMEYGSIPTPYRETACIRPDLFFGASKAAGTLLLQQLALSEEVPVVILRLFHVYGKMELEHRLIPTAIRAISQNTELPLTAPGYKHDFVYIDDVVDACFKAALQPDISAEIFNVATGVETSNEEIVACLGSLIGNPPRVQVGGFPERLCDRGDWCGDISLAGRRLGWEPVTSLREGLQKSIAWHNVVNG